MNTNNNVDLQYPSYQAQNSLQKITSGSILFFRTLFTYEDSQEKEISMLQEVYREVKIIAHDGAWGVIKRIGHSLLNHPLEIFMVAGASTLGYTNFKESLPLLPMALQTVRAWKNSQTLRNIAKKIDHPSFIDRSIKIGLYGLSALALCHSFPISPAAALEWNSYADARDYYSPATCKAVLNEEIEASHACIQEGNSFDQCVKLISNFFESDRFVFTRHLGGGVSIVQLGENQHTVCFLTADHPDAAVIKTCFADIHNPETRTTEILSDMKWPRAEEGLLEGHCVRHIALHSHAGAGASCATFHEMAAATDVGEHPTCLLTAIKPNAPVSQTCYDPENPSSITLKELKGINLSLQDNGKPVSIVVTDAKQFGLNPSLEPKSKPDCLWQFVCTSPESTSSKGLQ